MFAFKPDTPALELAELDEAFGRQELACALGRHPDTIGRWRQRADLPRKARGVIDRLWYAMHVACSERAWPTDAARYFMTTIEPRFGRRPVELIRQDDAHAREVVELIKTLERPEASDSAGSVQRTRSTVADPLAALLAPQPITARDLFGVDSVPMDLRGRLSPIGRDPDEFRVTLTAAESVVTALGSLED